MKTKRKEGGGRKKGRAQFVLGWFSSPNQTDFCVWSSANPSFHCFILYTILVYRASPNFDLGFSEKTP